MLAFIGSKFFVAFEKLSKARQGEWEKQEWGHLTTILGEHRDTFLCPRIKSKNLFTLKAYA